MEARDSPVKFLIEPEDTRALNGQRLAQLQCAIESVSRNGTALKPNWFKGTLTVSIGQKSILQRHTVKLSRLALSDLPAASPSEPSSAEAAGDQQEAHRPAQLEPSVTSYTLMIPNVTLADDDQYLCAAKGRTSRPGRLIVLQPPSQLNLASRIELAAGSESSAAAPLNGQVSGALSPNALLCPLATATLTHSAAATCQMIRPFAR